MKFTTTLSLAVATALVLALAVGAASASAGGFSAEKYPSTVEGTAGVSMIISTSNNNLTCSTNLGLTGSATGSPETLTTEFSSKEIPCAEGTITTNGCTLILHPGSETSKDNFGGSFEFGPDCTLSFTYFSCNTTISPQSGLGASYVNGGEGTSRSVSFSAAASGIKYTSTGACAKTGTLSNGTLSGTWNIKSKVSGTQYGIWAANPTGFFLTSGKEGERSLAFRAEKYPAGIINEWTTQFKLGTEFGNITCSREKIGGLISEATWALQMTRAAEYRLCTGLGPKATAYSNGCSTYYTLTSGAPYFGFYVLSCPGSAQLEVKTSECTLQFPPQQLGLVTYEETGSGANQTVLTQISGESIQYTATGTGCKAGTYKNGSASGAATLKAVA